MRFGESARDYEHAAEYFERIDGDLIGALRRLREAGVDRALGVRRDARDAAAARDRGRHPPSGPDRDRFAPGAVRHRGAAASGCRNARSAPASTSSSRRRACGLSASTRPAAATARPARAGRDRGQAPSRSRSTGRRSRSSGTTAATRRTRSIATTTLRASTVLRPWANWAGPTIAEAALQPRARACARLRRRAWRTARPLPRPSGAARACWSARSTPSCSVIGGTRARPGSRRWSRRRAATGLALATLPEALERHEPRERVASSSRAGARARTSSTWDSPRVAELLWPARRAELALVAALGGHAAGSRRGVGRDGRRARRAGAAGAPVERLGIHVDARAGGGLPAAAGMRPTRPSSSGRWPPSERT